jgi:hypothetical protein
VGPALFPPGPIAFRAIRQQADVSFFVGHDLVAAVGWMYTNPNPVLRRRPLHGVVEGSLEIPVCLASTPGEARQNKWSSPRMKMQFDAGTGDPSRWV